MEVLRDTHRETYKEYVLDNVAPNLITNSHSRSPRPPIRALCIRIRLPAAKRSVQIKGTSILNITADCCTRISNQWQ